MVRFEMNEEEADMIIAVMEASSHPAKDWWLRFMRNKRTTSGESISYHTMTDDDLTEESLNSSIMGNIF